MLLLVNACLQCVPFLSRCKNINKCSFYKKLLQKEAFFVCTSPACFAPALSSHKRGASQLFLAAVYLYGVNAFVQMLQSHGVAVAACRKGRLMKQLLPRNISDYIPQTVNGRKAADGRLMVSSPSGDMPMRAADGLRLMSFTESSFSRCSKPR